MKVFVLGHKGMLGHVVTQYLTDKGVEVETTNYRWPSLEFKKRVKEYRGDYIINCIGAIPQKTDKFEINYKLPVWLDINTKTNNIYCGTDCEDTLSEYGKSKLKISNWLKNHSKRTKIIKTSVYGPELGTNYSLMEWFLFQTKDIEGHAGYYWNGNSTLTWSEWCYNIMHDWDRYGKENILEGECNSKFTLLNILKEVFNKDINITPVDKPSINKCLEGNIKTKPLKDQILQLKSWIDENKYLYL